MDGEGAAPDGFALHGGVDLMGLAHKGQDLPESVRPRRWSPSRERRYRSAVPDGSWQQDFQSVYALALAIGSLNAGDFAVLRKACAGGR